VVTYLINMMSHRNGDHPRQFAFLSLAASSEPSNLHFWVQDCCQEMETLILNLPSMNDAAVVLIFLIISLSLLSIRQCCCSLWYQGTGMWIVTVLLASSSFDASLRKSTSSLSRLCSILVILSKHQKLLTRGNNSLKQVKIICSVL